MGMSGQQNALAALPPRKSIGTHCAGGWVGPGPVWKGAENLALPNGFDPRTVHPVASRCTDSAIAAHETATY